MQFNENCEELGEIGFKVLMEAVGDKSDLEDEARMQAQNIERQRWIDHTGIADLGDFVDEFDKFEKICKKYAEGDDDRMKAIVAPLLKAIDETAALIQPYYEAGRANVRRMAGENRDLQRQNADNMLDAASKGNAEQQTIPGI